MSAPASNDGGSESPSTIERESALLVDTLLAGFAARTTAPPDSPTSGPSGTPDHSRESDRGAMPEDDGAESRPPSADAPAEPDGAPPAENSATAGCTCGERGSAAARPGCAMCHLEELWHSIDPRLLENLADVAALMADGLRSAARRLAEHHTEHSHPERNRTA